MTDRPIPRRRAERTPRGHPGLVPATRTRSRKVDCIDFVERVTDYLEDAVATDERERIDRHLEDCPDCTRALAQWRKVIDLVGRLGEEVVDEVEPTTRDHLLAAFRDEPPT